MKARHPSKSRALEVAIRPQGDTEDHDEIRAMDEESEEKQDEEQEPKRRRRVTWARDGHQDAAAGGDSGARESEEMKELRKGLGMDEEDGDALRPEEATEADMECGVSNGEEELGQSVVIEGEEGRASVGIRAPQRVSTVEREEHETTHTPYRGWCPYCVKGRGRNTPHRKGQKGKDDAEVKVPRVSMDYFFMSQQDEKANTNPIIVMLDEETNDKYARAVGQKGVGVEHEMDWLIKDMSLEMKAWWHAGGDGSSLILKSDGEKPIVAVREALAKYHGGRIVPDLPAKGESQSNGAVEEAGKTCREFTRVLKEQLEDKAKVKLESKDDVIQWMVRWGAMLCSRYLCGHDGRTAYERRG